MFYKSETHGTAATGIFPKFTQEIQSFFELDFVDVSKISSNATADVVSISHDQRHRRRTLCFVRILNESGVLSYVFYNKRKSRRYTKQVANNPIDKWTQMIRRFFFR